MKMKRSRFLRAISLLLLFAMLAGCAQAGKTGQQETTGTAKSSTGGSGAETAPAEGTAEESETAPAEGTGRESEAAPAEGTGRESEAAASEGTGLESEAAPAEERAEESETAAGAGTAEPGAAEFSEPQEEALTEQQKTEKMIRESKEIMAVLDREGISVAEVADYHQYPVADNPSGRLSADRLEYTLGNFLNFHTGTLEDCVRFYRDLTVGTNEYGEPELVFHDLENARSFAEKALVNSVIYSQDEDRYAMEYLAGILRKAMNRRVLNYEDLWTTEPEVIARLKSDPEILREWEKFGGFSRVEKSAEKQTGDGWLKIDAKRRYIDPYTEGCGRISEGLAEMKEKIDGYRNLSYDYYLKGY